jgi:hypothetical protein
MTVFDIPGQRREEEFVRKGDADPMMLKFATSQLMWAQKICLCRDSLPGWRAFQSVPLAVQTELDQLVSGRGEPGVFSWYPYSPRKQPGRMAVLCVRELLTHQCFLKDVSGLTSYITRCQSFCRVVLPTMTSCFTGPYLISGKPDGRYSHLTIHGIESG